MRSLRLLFVLGLWSFAGCAKDAVLLQTRPPEVLPAALNRACKQLANMLLDQVEGNEEDVSTALARAAKA